MRDGASWVKAKSVSMMTVAHQATGRERQRLGDVFELGIKELKGVGVCVGRIPRPWG